MIKILYCDNDSAMREKIREYLIWYEYHVDTCSQPQDVMPQLQKVSYDLLICEARMEPVNGYDFCAELRESGRQDVKDIPILIVTPENPNYEECQFLRRKNLYCLVKYKSPEKWREKINAILYHRQSVQSS